MVFKKGDKKIAGRKKGTPNKKTSLWDEFGDQMMGDYADFVKKYMKELQDAGKYEEFMKHYKDLLNFFKPKMQSSQTEDVTPEKLTRIEIVEIKDEKTD